MCTTLPSAPPGAVKHPLIWACRRRLAGGLNEGCHPLKKHSKAAEPALLRRQTPVRQPDRRWRWRWAGAVHSLTTNRKCFLG